MTDEPGPDRRPRRVLFVEPDETTRISVKLLLELSDDDVLVVTIGHPEAAIRHLEREPFDLVITALRFPGASAHGLLAAVAEIAPDVRTLVVYSPWEDGQDELPGDDQIAGPLDPRRFREKVSALLPPSVREAPRRVPDGSRRRTG